MMIPIRPKAAGAVVRSEGLSRRSVALSHAILRGRPGLWGDDPNRPKTVLWVRGGDNQTEVYAEGRPGPALDWLAERPGAHALMAPGSWREALSERFGETIWRGHLETCVASRATCHDLGLGPVPARRLTADDEGAFLSVAPDWALRSWDSYRELLQFGAAIGIEHRDEFAALAWTLESGNHRDCVGVFTVPRFRRLGLGRSAASALTLHILRDRRRYPLWALTPGNVASLGLARALYYCQPPIGDTLWRWNVESPSCTAAPSHST